MVSMNRSILVVEDESDLADLICYNLQREGYECRRAAAGDAALQEIKKRPPDLLLLDRMLPNVSGDKVAEEVRKDPATASLPIIMLTAKVEESDELVGFALGANDYITKPFSMKVLVARISAMLRRREAAATEQTILRQDHLSLDPQRHEIKINDIPVPVTATEFRLLRVLMEARGRVLDRSQLIDKVLGQGAVVLDRTIDVHITALRKKLTAIDRTGQAAAWVQTVRGVGYAFRKGGEE